jgi:hypothetical protein
MGFERKRKRTRTRTGTRTGIGTRMKAKTMTTPRTRWIDGRIWPGIQEEATQLGKREWVRRDGLTKTED